MSKRHPDLEQFLTAHQRTIALLIEQAYVEAGGHYARLTAAERAAQAEADSAELIAALVRGDPDRASIQQAVRGPDLTVGSDVVRMSVACERLWLAWLAAQPGLDPAFRRDLERRSALAYARFRLNMSAAQIETLVQHYQEPPDSPKESS